VTGAAAITSLSTFALFTGGLAIVGVATIANFMWHRAVTTYTLNARQIENSKFWFKNEKFTDTNGHEVEQNVRPTLLVRQLIKELNVYFKREFPNSHVDLPEKIPLFTFEDNGFKIITVEGRNPEEAGLFFSSGFFNWNKPIRPSLPLLLLIANELVKIYLRRGIYRHFIGCVTDVFNTLKTLLPENYFTYVALAPFLFAQAEKRRFEYESVRHVVKMGRGKNLVDGIDFKVCPTLELKPTNAELSSTGKNISVRI